MAEYFSELHTNIPEYGNRQQVEKNEDEEFEPWIPIISTAFGIGSVVANIWAMSRLNESIEIHWLTPEDWSELSNALTIAYTIEAISISVGCILILVQAVKCIRKIFAKHKHTYKFRYNMNQTDENIPMLFRDDSAEEFDFDSILGDSSLQTVCGCRVTIDKILRDITKTTVLGVSGTMILRGVRIRGVWDTRGNIIECRKMLRLTSPKSMFVSIDNLLQGNTESMFRLVSVSSLGTTQKELHENA